MQNGRSSQTGSLLMNVQPYTFNEILHLLHCNAFPLYPTVSYLHSVQCFYTPCLMYTACFLFSLKCLSAAAAAAAASVNHLNQRWSHCDGEQED